MTGRLQEHSFTVTRGERAVQEIRRIELVAEEVAVTKFAVVRATKAIRRPAEDESSASAARSALAEIARVGLQAPTRE